MKKVIDSIFDEEQLEQLGKIIENAKIYGPSADDVEKNRREASEMSFGDLLIQIMEQHGVICHVKSDNAFTRKARCFQAIKRHEQKALPGYVVKDGMKIYYGNLALGGVDNNYNFLTEDIFEYAKQRAENKEPYETINKERLMCNFLSSQPMAFNLFYPLMKSVEENQGEELAFVLKSFIDKDNKKKIVRIKEIGIEYIPEYYKDCLGDKTAMDAYFIYETQDAKTGIVAVETKYTDVLGKNEAKDTSIAKRIISEELSDLFTESFLESINNGETKLTQLYRNFLLTEKVRLVKKYDDSMSIVLAPKENVYNKSEEDQLKKNLNENYSYKFQTIDLESFVDALITAFPENEVFRKFYSRYLDF